MRVAQIARLSWADLKHDWLMSLCMVTSLVAVIGPLLLLFGLKHGVVSTLQAQLLNDPRNLEIRMLSSGSHDQAWIDQLAAEPGVGFVLGLTRSLSTQADFLRSGAQFLNNAEVLPTAQGDPLLAGIDVASLPYAGGVFSSQAARRLGVASGDVVRLRVARRLEGVDQHAVLEMTVQAVLPAEAYGRPAVFVHPALLRDMEWYRDGYAVSALGAVDGQPEAQARLRYAKARLYARGIDDVEALEKHLNDQHIETASHLADIRNVRDINRLLTVVFSVIAATGALGCLASLAGAFLANVRRKRRDIATLRLLGLRGAAVNVYILLQAALLTLVAFAIGLGVYAVGSGIFNRLLGQARDMGQFACRISPGHALTALALTLGVALFASFVGAASARRIQPAESLREI
ncbi:ABC transporter transmembrane protein [Bordetella ansorpii]|uniref:ABC transporter transmembrane protein n=1 Tax=Bordetella ansorpii TaxID=288768 RepID=A0A157PZR7_9BORD|nr:FtsX-like permease family protein [Bordetella ansorpii]SAI39102.1 ABC transporter transmembrane protein [Bordetella ansorpii]